MTASPTIPEDVRGAVERLTQWLTALDDPDWPTELTADGRSSQSRDLRSLLTAYTALLAKVEALEGERRAFKDSMKPSHTIQPPPSSES